MIYFIVPAYNEAANLPDLLLSLRQWAERRDETVHVIVVDDGSTDETEQILQAHNGLRMTVARHSPNRGVAAAFRTGFETWRRLPSEPHDLVVSLEADNTSSLEILDLMLERARSGYDVTLASCYAPGGEVVGTNLLRTMLSFCANLILRCTPGMPSVSTFSSFYRAYRGPFLSRAVAAYEDRLIEEEGFVCVVELLLKFARMDARICEVPLRLDGGRRKGPSKMRVMRTIRGYLDLFLHATAGQLAQPKAEAGAVKVIAAGGEASTGQ